MMFSMISDFALAHQTRQTCVDWCGVCGFVGRIVWQRAGDLHDLGPLDFRECGQSEAGAKDVKVDCKRTRLAN